MEVAALTLIFTIMFVQLFLGLCMEHSAHHGVSVDVPRTLHPKSMGRAQRKDALVVAILRSGAIFLGGDMISPDNLGHKLHDRLWSNGGERKVYIRADALARWGRVGEVIDQVRAAGVPEVGFLVDQRRQ